MLDPEYIDAPDIPVNPALRGPSTLADLGQLGAFRVARAAEDMLGYSVLLCLADFLGPVPCPGTVRRCVPGCPTHDRLMVWAGLHGSLYLSCHSPLEFHLKRLVARLRRELPRRLDPMRMLADRLCGRDWHRAGRGGAA